MRRSKLKEGDAVGWLLFWLEVGTYAFNNGVTPCLSLFNSLKKGKKGEYLASQLDCEEYVGT